MDAGQAGSEVSALLMFSHLISRKGSHDRHPVVPFSQEDAQSVQFALHKDHQKMGNRQNMLHYLWETGKKNCKKSIPSTRLS